MTESPSRFAQSLAAQAETDFGALERRRPEVEARLQKFSQAEQQEFRAELARLLKRHEIARSKPNFRRAWKGSKD